MPGMNYSLLPPQAGPMPVQIAETDVNPVIAGGDQFGWVSGTIANLPAGAIATVVFDLGPLWFRYPLAAICITPDATIAGGLGAVSITGSDTPEYNAMRRLKDAQTGGILGLGSALGQYSAGQCFVRPIGRYLAIRITNAATVVQPLKITLAAYPS